MVAELMSRGGRAASTRRGLVCGACTLDCVSFGQRNGRAITRHVEHRLPAGLRGASRGGLLCRLLREELPLRFLRLQTATVSAHVLWPC